MQAGKIRCCAIYAGAALVVVILVGVYIYLGWQWTVATLQAGRVSGPAEVATIARRITDYDLPPGYSELQGMSLLGVDMAVIGPSGQMAGVTIMLYQSPPGAGVTLEEMELQLRRLSPAAFGPAELEPVEQKLMELRGDPTTLSFLEGLSAEGERWREVRGTFRGKAGPAGVFIVGPAAEWDRRLVDDFLASLR